MPTTHRGRPPGRRDRRRPPEGPALLPATSQHTAILATIRKAKKSVPVLRKDGHPELAADVKESLDYALEVATKLSSRRPSEGTTPNHALRVVEPFRTHVHAAAEGTEDVADVVRRRMRDFLEGKWTPGPSVRARRGHRPAKVNLNVRVADVLWDDVNELGKDPQAAAERGYKLTAEQVAIRALEERFGLPETEEATTTA